MAIIIPAILAKTKEDFQKDLQKLLNSRNLSSGWVHIDFMDNIFVPNKSITPEDLENIDFGSLKKEAHLMVQNPYEWISKLQNFSRIYIHAESEEIHRNIEILRNSGVEVGLAINPETSVDAVVPFLGLVDVILIMGVNPGFQGQSFILHTLHKIKEAKKYNIKIAVDGAVKDINAKEIVQAGADILISGSFLIQNPDENLVKLKQAIYVDLAKGG